MAPPVDIPLPNAHPRVGLLVKTTDPDEAPLRPADPELLAAYGVLVYWPRAYAGWLKVEGEIDTGPGATPARLSPQPTDLDAVIKHLKADGLVMAQQVLTEQWVYENAFLVGAVTAPAAVRLTFKVDTNIEEFVRFVADADGDEKPVGLTALYFDGKVVQPDAQPVRLLLRPATPVPAAKVLLGLDLGNTTTTAAVLDPFARDGKGLAAPTQRIPMLSTRTVPGHRAAVIGATDPNGSPIASELRFDLFRTYAPPGAEVPANRRFPDLRNFSDDRPNAVDYVVGDAARAAGLARSVVLGAKRMASVRPRRAARGRNDPRYPAHQVIAPHRVVYDPPRPDAPDPGPKPAVMEVDVRAPLELLACRVFQHFREARLGWPAKIALTYPTTYSRYELQALRRAVQQGWLRMQAAGQGSGYDAPPADPELGALVRQLQGVVRGPLDLDTQARDPVIQLLLDEASAAAFFHLYRRIFELGDGGLNGFRYQYEHGLHMLLYDCGGGTTDIALVRAVVEADARTLRITVLRRTGVRTFGGDDITRQLCRLLKAKIAGVLAAERKKRAADPPRVSTTRPPADDKGWRALAADLERFVADTAALDPGDDLVPTRFDAGQTPAEERRAAALALWRLGEQLKHQLSADKAPPWVPADRFTPGVAQLPLWTWTRETSALTRALLPEAAEQQAQLKRRLEAVTVTRTELDALVYEPVMRSIANCNALIQSVLEPADGPTGEVHWVVASGNAVRYPLLQRVMKERLAVPFLDDPKRFTFDPDNAKDATAKGAVLALAAMESQAQQIDPKFDSDLSDLLPYSVGYHDLTVDGVKVLYTEHTHYRKLTEREPVVIPLPALSGNGVPPNKFTLMRQFPGDDGFHNFLAFEFPDGGIQGGHLKVSYDDTDEYEFRVVDGGGAEGVPTDLTAGDTYVAPAQRGDI